MKKIIFLAILLVTSVFSFAQPAGTIDDNFNSGIGANNVIHNITFQPNGKFIIVGEFTSYNGNLIKNIARINADGTLDASFKPDSGINSIYNFKIQPDGKIIVVGNFTTYNGTIIEGIARLNSDGSLDTSFNLGKVNDYIGSLDIQHDGKIIIGGKFTTFNGILRYFIARLNSDGTLDNSFNTGTGINDIVNSICIQFDGKIILGGKFSNSIKRLNTDGTFDINFNGTGVGANDQIFTIELQSDRKILIGGMFNKYNNINRYKIARLNVDGSLDTSFVNNVLSSGITTISCQPDGKIMVGGAFIDGNHNRIARLNSNGTIDNSFNSTGFDAQTNCIKYSNGKIIVVGYFLNYNGTVKNRIVCINIGAKIYSNIFNDINSNCSKDNLESLISGNIPISIQPGNFIVQSSNGSWLVDSLPIGNYTATIDTNSQWKASCSPSVTFTVVHPDSFVLVTPIGMFDTKPCTATGIVYNDLNSNCFKDALELKKNSNLNLIIQPGNIVTQVVNGIWRVDSLPYGNYTATIDTSGQLKTTCPTIPFTFTQPNSFLQNLNFGMRNINSCTEPDISILAPSLRRCFSNQIVYVEAKNLSTASQIMYNSYADIKIDSFLTIISSTRPYVSLGNHTYRFELDSLYPGQSKSWEISTNVSCDVILGQTLCMQANLFPVAPCVLDSTPNGTGCLGPWDNSFLRVTGLCDTDSIRFEIRNLGSGDMDCFRDIRLFIDGQFFSLDSIKLLAGGIHKIAILGDARTWRLEADQHPLVPGNSHPNATVELCGDSLLQSQNWTSNKVNILPMDDADPVVDIYCGVVSGSYDPNDKTGYPIGVDFGHYILPNQQMQYVIRFQNTGTDTAFKVVIRDTLETDLNIFSVVSGVSSHYYSFRMFGPRILEWTFNNIMLPDSFHSEPNSHGFVTFSVEQNENLPSGTSIDNSAAIYFDFNSPVITNTSHHEIQRELLTTGVDAKVTKGDVLVYPNPNNGFFKVELPMSSTPLRQQKITICNVMGQVVYISTLNDQSIEIDLSKQPNGIYFLKVENGGMEWNKKVVKN